MLFGSVWRICLEYLSWWEKHCCVINETTIFVIPIHICLIIFFTNSSIFVSVWCQWDCERPTYTMYTSFCKGCHSIFHNPTVYDKLLKLSKSNLLHIFKTLYECSEALLPNEKSTMCSKSPPGATSYWWLSYQNTCGHKLYNKIYAMT